MFSSVVVGCVQINLTYNLLLMECLMHQSKYKNSGKHLKVRLFTAADVQAGASQEEVLTIGLQWSAASPKSIGIWYTSAICWLYG
jgi:hypothetical protein